VSNLESRLNEIAKKHGLRPLMGDLRVTSDYADHRLAIIMVELGLMKADEVKAPVAVYEEHRNRTGKDWPDK
jgi:hypothetical protein